MLNNCKKDCHIAYTYNWENRRGKYPVVSRENYARDLDSMLEDCKPDNKQMCQNLK